MAKSRIRYSKDFKAHAVGLVSSGGGSLTHAAKALGISPGMLSKWIKAAGQEAEPRGNREVTPDVAVLERRVGHLEESIRILRGIVETSLREKAYKGMA